MGTRSTPTSVGNGRACELMRHSPPATAWELSFGATAGKAENVNFSPTPSGLAEIDDRSIRTNTAVSGGALLPKLLWFTAGALPNLNAARSGALPRGGA